MFPVHPRRLLPTNMGGKMWSVAGWHMCLGILKDNCGMRSHLNKDPFLLAVEAQAPAQFPVDVRPTYWVESSKAGDLWLFFREGFLFAGV